MKLSDIDRTRLIFGAALFLGTIVRFAPTLMTGFPLNDGGMFLSMIRDLRANGYILPLTTSYNFSGIPYAYPPLGFFLAGWLAGTGLNETFVLQLLPAVASTFAIYGIYLFAAALTRSRELGASAALIYALAPRSFTWLVMGGGLTRALGFCFVLYTGWAAYRLFQSGSRKWLGLSVLFAVLTVLSHPEATVHAIWLCILLWLFYGRTRGSALHAIWVAMGTIVLTMPWWARLLAYHGVNPLLSVINTGMHGALTWATFWRSVYTDDSLLPVMSVLFVVALLWGIWRRQHFMWVWSLTAVAAEPRSALNAMVFPLSILLAMLLSDLARRMATRHQRMWEILFVVLTIYLFAESYLFSFRLVSASLTPDDRAAMEWVREHTPVESQFVLLTGVPAPELDSFQEWFPTLAERKSVTTFQGTEWTLGPRFFSNFKELKELQECVNAECLQAWIAESQISFDYVLVRKRNLSTELIISIRSDKKFETLYEDGVIVLFAQE